MRISEYEYATNLTNVFNGIKYSWRKILFTSVYTSYVGQCSIYTDGMSDLSLPSLLPKVVDSPWFCVDKPVDDHEELCKLEEEHQAWVSIVFHRVCLIPRAKVLWKV